MKLADWMTTQGITDDTVATGVETDRTTIGRIRRGLTRPSWELAARLKAFTGGAVTADDFLPEPAAME
jgi:DNA-binding XRE family transcriptional regulator